MYSNKSDSGFIVKLLRNGVLVLILVVFVRIVYNFNNRQIGTETALISSSVSSRDFKGVFIRDEKVITFSGNGVLSYNIADGGKVASDTVIAEVYPDDEQIGRNREINNLEKELTILKKIQNPGTRESAQPATLSENIGESYRSLIYNREMHNYSEVRDEMENLIVDMSTYQIITKQVEGFTQQIADINAKLAELKADSVAPSETVKSKESAYFVSYCDGYESELTPDRLDEITVADINSITDRRSDDGTIVGKMINGYSWYLAGVVDNSRKEYAVGNYVQVKFDSSDETFDAVIDSVRDEGNPELSIIILKCSQFNYDLVQHRAENAKLIKGEYSGLKVPRESIRFEDIEENVYDDNDNIVGKVTTNYKGVRILKGEQIVFKKIDVIYEGSDYVLSAVHDDDSDYLALYDDIITEGEENG
ncbi:MAG: hypothetical protein NC340_07095 [Ruminococcus flavefaciens]|nr:hypothetical protein [Ruminococcus flavefaciens]MCM1229507.1 hypothetical protein [Ruminococcus flavefaciens]